MHAHLPGIIGTLLYLKLGVGRSIGAPMHLDTLFEGIRIDTHNH